MEPTLLDGDSVLVRRGGVRVGDVVVATHPDRPGLLIVKRATRHMEDGTWWLEGDNPKASHDSWLFGGVDVDRVIGKVVLRYRPGRPTMVRRDH
jgi:nickel-type superoxide dismutase maturation protease